MRLSENYSTDESIPLQLIEDYCHTARLTLANISSNKSAYYQKICCIPVVCKDIECDGMVLENIKTITIPEIASDYKPLLTTVSVKDKVLYTYLGKDKSKPTKSRLLKVLNKSSFTLIDNNTIVVYDDNPIEYLCVSAVFNNPYDTALIDCLEKNRNNYAYPMPGKMIIKLEDTVYRLLRSRDRTLNQKDDGSPRKT